MQEAEVEKKGQKVSSLADQAADLPRSTAHAKHFSIQGPASSKQVANAHTLKSRVAAKKRRKKLFDDDSEEEEEDKNEVEGNSTGSFGARHDQQPSNGRFVRQALGEASKRANTDGTEEEQPDEEEEGGGEQMQSIVRKMFYKEAPVQPRAAKGGKREEETSKKGLEDAIVKERVALLDR